MLSFRTLKTKTDDNLQSTKFRPPTHLRPTVWWWGQPLWHTWWWDLGTWQGGLTWWKPAPAGTPPVVIRTPLGWPWSTWPPRQASCRPRCNTGCSLSSARRERNGSGSRSRSTSGWGCWTPTRSSSSHLGCPRWTLLSLDSAETSATLVQASGVRF